MTDSKDGFRLEVVHASGHWANFTDAHPIHDVAAFTVTGHWKSFSDVWHPLIRLIPPSNLNITWSNGMVRWNTIDAVVLRRATGGTRNDLSCRVLEPSTATSWPRPPGRVVEVEMYISRTGDPPLLQLAAWCAPLPSPEMRISPLLSEMDFARALCEFNRRVSQWFDREWTDLNLNCRRVVHAYYGAWAGKHLSTDTLA